MPRAAKPTGKMRHDPLHVQLKEDEIYEKYGNVSRPGKRKKSKKDEGDNGTGEVSAYNTRMRVVVAELECRVY